MMWPYMSSFGWGGWLLGGLMMLLFWGGLIALVVFTIRGFSRSGNRLHNQIATSPTNAFEVVKNRYAQGEISKEEFETIRHDLES